MGHCVGIDLHRRRSVIVILDEDDEEVWTRKIDARLLAYLSRMGMLPEAWIAPGPIGEQR